MEFKTEIFEAIVSKYQTSSITHLQVVIVRLVAQLFPIDGVCGHITLIIIDNNETLTRHGNQFGRIEIHRRIKRTQEITKCGMYQHRTVYKERQVKVEQILACCSKI